MEICRIQHHKKDYLELLLLGDEQESMIDRYLERGDMYVLYDSGAAKAVCVVTEESEEILELKNLAVCSQCQRRGYGRRMIEFLCDQYKGKKRILQAGTGDSPATLPFYEACGFTQSHRIPGFFVDNYDHRVWKTAGGHGVFEEKIISSFFPLCSGWKWTPSMLLGLLR